MPAVAVTRDQFHNLVQGTYGDKAFRGEYDGDNNLVYAGFALPGTTEDSPSWQLKQLMYDSNNLTEIIWPQINGKATTDYSFAWDDRATYTYS